MGQASGISQSFGGVDLTWLSNPTSTISKYFNHLTALEKQPMIGVSLTRKTTRPIRTMLTTMVFNPCYSSPSSVTINISKSPILSPHPYTFLSKSVHYRHRKHQLPTSGTTLPHPKGLILSSFSFHFFLLADGYCFPFCMFSNSQTFFLPSIGLPCIVF